MIPEVIKMKRNVIENRCHISEHYFNFLQNICNIEKKSQHNETRELNWQLLKANSERFS